MLNERTESPLYPIVNPRSVAFFGASNNYTSMGTTQLTVLKALGYEGAVYPVHPREETVLGYKAYRNVADLPEVPDLAVLVLPTTIVSDVLDECGRKGIRHAIVISGGFREVGGEGVALEKQLLETARKHNIRFLGPNCIGAVNSHHKFNTTFHRYECKAGFIGMASQSGSFITQMFDYLSLFGLGFSTGFSVGNEANIDIVDCMEYLALDPDTKVIGLYIEGIRRGRAFIETARAIAPKKPIVAFYVGGSEEGKRAGFSHTGALAGPDRLYDGVFRQSGIIRASSIEELFDMCWALGTCAPLKGPEIIIQTHSGGPGAAAADACGREGLKLPPLHEQTRDRLKNLIPHTASTNNPVDLTFNKNPLDYFSTIPKALLDDPNTFGLLIYLLMPLMTVRQVIQDSGVPADKVEEQTTLIVRVQAESVARLLRGGEKPLVGYSFHSRDDLFVREAQDAGIPVLPSPTRAARAMGALLHYGRLREKIRKGEPFAA